eukprot:9485552-Pyramimonas_sp.AAC.1
MTTTATTRSSSRRRCAAQRGAAASPSARSRAPKSASDGNKGRGSPTTSSGWPRPSSGSVAWAAQTSSR